MYPDYDILHRLMNESGCKHNYDLLLIISQQFWEDDLDEKIIKLLADSEKGGWLEIYALTVDYNEITVITLYYCQLTLDLVEIFMSSVKFVVVFVRQKARSFERNTIPNAERTLSQANPFHNIYKRLNHLVMLQDGEIWDSRADQ